MKNLFKSVFNLKTILNCYISAVGYGIGYNVPFRLNWHPIICIVCCLVLGTVFDFIARRILSSNYFNGSLLNKITLTSFIYVSYILVWFIVDTTIGYDLDNDFLLSLGFIIIIQIVLLIIKMFKNYLKERKK